MTPIPARLAELSALRDGWLDYRGWPVVVASESATDARTAAIRVWRNVHQAPIPWVEVRVKRAPQYDLYALTD